MDTIGLTYEDRDDFTAKVCLSSSRHMSGSHRCTSISRQILASAAISNEWIAPLRLQALITTSAGAGKGAKTSRRA